MGIIPYSTETLVEDGGSGGFSTFGILFPTRGTQDGAPIKTQVVDWPFEEDENGIPFDQANLWGVRTRCFNMYDPDFYGPFDGAYVGDQQWLTAVPKQLPPGYTYKGRCGHIYPLTGDFLGESPFFGVVDGSMIRRPVYWRDANGIAPSADGYFWTPMNHNDRGEFVTTFVGVYSSTVGLALVAGPTNHIGMRGIKGTMYGLAGNTYQIIVTVEEPGDPSPTMADPPPNQVWAGSVHVGGNADFDIDEMGDLFGDLGELKDYYFWIRETRPGGASSLTGGGNIYWGPRTDVPLWYTATTRNRVSPGGIILP